MPKYVEITAPEFEAGLPRGWRRGYEPGTLELIYDYPVSDEFLVRVLSSIYSGRTRPKNEDAIRVMVYHVWQRRSFVVLPRVYRQDGWQDSLGKRVEEAKSIIVTDRWPYCPSCGHRMRLIANVQNGTAFWGCSAWAKDVEGSCPITFPFGGSYFREESDPNSRV